MEEKHYKKLIEKYLSGTISDSEAAELLIWLEHDKTLNKWWGDELINGNNKMDIDLQDELLDKVKTTIQEREISRRISAKSRKLFPKRSIFKWAAIICIPILLSIPVYMLLHTEQYDTPLVVKAESGNRTDLVLPDGTHVKLNSASQLSYWGHYGVKERRVILNGEAYFNVTHDAKHPFIVQTGGLQVVVLGTTFNISSYEDQENVSIVLLEGKVGVYVNNQKYLMKPDDKIVYNKQTHKMVAAKVYSQDYIEWTKGNLYFDNEPLQNIAKVLERTYNIKIQIDSETLKNERFSGSVGNGGGQSILEKLTMAFPFTYEFKDSVIMLKQP